MECAKPKLNNIMFLLLRWIKLIFNNWTLLIETVMVSLCMCAHFILSQGKTCALFMDINCFWVLFVREENGIHATFHPTKPKTLPLDQCEWQNAHKFKFSRSLSWTFHYEKLMKLCFSLFKTAIVEFKHSLVNLSWAMCVFDQLFMKYLYKQPLQLHLSKKCLIYNTLSIICHKSAYLCRSFNGRGFYVFLNCKVCVLLFCCFCQRQ